MKIFGKNRRSHFFGNWLLSLASWAIPLGLAFVSTPIIVRRLGTEQYGLYAVVLGYLAAAFSTGVGKLSAKYIPEFRAAGDPKKLSEALSSTVLIAVGLGGLQAFVLTVVAPFVSTDILLLNGTAAEEVTLGLRLAALTGLIMVNSQVFQFAAQGLHRFDIFAVLSILNSILANGGNIVLVLNGYGFVSLLVWNAVVSLAVAVLFFIRCRPLLPEWKFTIRFDSSVFRPALVYAGSIVVYQGVTSILFAFERSWIVRKFGAETVAYYVIPLMLATYLHSFLGSFVQVLFPVVNELLNDRDRLIGLYQRATKMIFIATAFLVTSYIATGRSLLDVWLGTPFGMRSGSVLSILAVTFGLNAVSMIVWLLAESFKAPSINALSSTVCSIATIVVMVLAARVWGVDGIAFARLFGIVLTVPLIFMIEKRFLGSVFWRFWLSLSSRTLFSCIALGLLEFFILKALGESWISLITAGMSGLAVYAFFLFASRLVTREELTKLLPIGKSNTEAPA